MTNEKNVNGNHIEHGYQPSGREERGYQPSSNANRPAPSALPTTGSSVTQPSTNSSTISSKDGGTK